MKLLSEHRCPWCGEVIDPIISPKERYDLKKCEKCGEEYMYHHSTVLSLITDLLYVFLLIFAALGLINIAYLIMYLIFFAAAIIIVNSTARYERYEEEELYMKRYSARLTFAFENKNSITEYIKIRLMLMEKSVIPICFTKSDDLPVSHVVCISIERLKKISDTKYSCEFTFLPLSPVSYDPGKAGDFYVFDSNKKRVGSGIITSELNKTV